MRNVVSRTRFMRLTGVAPPGIGKSHKRRHSSPRFPWKSKDAGLVHTVLSLQTDAFAERAPHADIPPLQWKYSRSATAPGEVPKKVDASDASGRCRLRERSTTPSHISVQVIVCRAPSTSTTASKKLKNPGASRWILEKCGSMTCSGGRCQAEQAPHRYSFSSSSFLMFHFDSSFGHAASDCLPSGKGATALNQQVWPKAVANFLHVHSPPTLQLPRATGSA